jgi:hypothetical protein
MERLVPVRVQVQVQVQVPEQAPEQVQAPVRGLAQVPGLERVREPEPRLMQARVPALP